MPLCLIDLSIRPSALSVHPSVGLSSSKVYMADLESALHYLLRVELATHNTLGGEELKTFKSVVTVIAKVPSILCGTLTLLCNLCLGGCVCNVFYLMCVCVCVRVKLYPGRASVQKVMENLLDWLVRLPLESIPYQAILDLVDDKMRVSSSFIHGTGPLHLVQC